jgi:hypothetical protein
MTLGEVINPNLVPEVSRTIQFISKRKISTVKAVSSSLVPLSTGETRYRSVVPQLWTIKEVLAVMTQ